MLRLILSILLAGAVLASWVYWMLAWGCTRRFFRARRSVTGNYLPRVTILKPVKGVDANAFDNFATFCRQEYPDYELLFGVADAKDPVATVVNQLREQFPHRPIRLIVAEPTAANPKSSTLDRLAAEAAGEVLVISDGDIRVREDYLRQVVDPLRDSAVGLVTCPYVGAQPGSFAARLEALHMDVTFLPSAILAHELLGDCVGMGATLAIRKADLQRLGGYAAFRDHLMDDYELARRIRELGLKSRISACIVESVLGQTRFGDQWAREVRWARGIRVVRPAKYPGLLLTHGTAVSVLLLFASGFYALSWIALVGSLLIRWMIAWDLLGVLGKQTTRRDLVPLPVRDVLSFFVWCAGLVGRRVTWRGQRFALRRDGSLKSLSSRGRLTPSSGAPGEGGGEGIWPATQSHRLSHLARSPHPSPLPEYRERGPEGLPVLTQHSAPSTQHSSSPDLLGRLVLWLDRSLRRRQGIFEFSDDPECIFRISLGTCDQELTLSDGTRAQVGQIIGDLHFYNEHLPRIPTGGPSLAWARRAQRMAQRSMQLLAEAAMRDPRLAGVEIFRGQSVVSPRGGLDKLLRLTTHLHLDLHDPPGPPTLGQRLHDWGENLLIWALVRTFNPAGLRGAKLRRERHRFWISRRTLMTAFGGTGILPASGGLESSPLTDQGF